MVWPDPSDDDLRTLLTVLPIVMLYISADTHIERRKPRPDEMIWMAHFPRAATLALAILDLLLCAGALWIDDPRFKPLIWPIAILCFIGLGITSVLHWAQRTDEANRG